MDGNVAADSLLHKPGPGQRVGGEELQQQLGNRTFDDSAVPVSVEKAAIPSPHFITAVAAGFLHSVALSSAGEVYTWGAGSVGQLGHGLFGGRAGIATSVDTNGPLGSIAFGIGAGGQHSLAIGTSGVTNSVPDIALSTNHLNFGNVAIGSSANLTLTVSNVGRVVLAVNSLSSDNSSFAFISISSFNLSAGQHQSGLTFRFTPTTAGLQTGTVFIASNDPDEPLLRVPVQGVGLTPSFPDLAVSPTRLNFGAVTNGSNRDLDLTLRNDGSAMLNVSSLAINNPRFTVISEMPPFAVPGGLFRLVTLRFSPADASIQTGSLSIASNDPNEPARLVPLAGSGIGAGNAVIAASFSSAGNQLTLAWPLALTGFVLEVTPTLSPDAVWTPVGNVLVIGDQNRVTITTSGGSGFYRLRKQ